MNIFVESPKIVQHPKDREVEEGEAVTFTCVAEGVPKPSVLWFEGDNTISSMSTTVGNRVTRLVL